MEVVVIALNIQSWKSYRNRHCLLCNISFVISGCISSIIIMHLNLFPRVLKMYPVEEALYAPYKMTNFNEDLIKVVLDQLLPSNVQ